MKLFSTSCETLYLGWDGPLLPRSVATLRERYAKKGCFDLAPTVCVLPSTRAAQRFQSLLQWQAEEHKLELRPPQIVTVGQLPELLYQPTAPLALEFEQTLGWAQVLRSAEPSELLPLVASVPPPEPVGPWLELASTLRRLHEDLSANQLSFGDVVEAAETDAEQRRWRLLDSLFGRYLVSMEQAGLVDPHWQRSQAVAADRCKTDKTVVLIGTSDLSGSLVAMLRSVHSDLIAIVAAPPDAASRFDEFGCVDTSSWLDQQLPLQDHQLIAAGDVGDQATAVAEVIAGFAERFSADQVTVGVTDPSQVGPLEIELRGCGVETFRHLGWSISETSVGRLLDLAATYLHRRTWQSLAALVRHADVHALITRSLQQQDSLEPQDRDSDWLTQLDQLLSNHYPIRVRQPLPPQAIADYPVALAIGQWVEQWMSVFAGADRSIAAWSGVIGDWLDQVYDAGAASSGQPTAVGPLLASPPVSSATGRTSMALGAARRMIERFVALNDQLDLHVGGAAAIETLSGRLADVRVASSPSAQQVEILGWLDLALDDAPAMVVLGLNHPFVPGATTNDPFLPGSLRTRLRMNDNDRRYARDVYAMHVMLSTRLAIRFIVGRTAADRSPTPPSRLLAAAPSADTARRVRRLLGGKRDRVLVHHRWDQDGGSLLPIPALPAETDPIAAITSMSVTAFRDYLACPYRFYLRHVLKLKPLDDQSSELAANQFGDLVHASLERFGESDDRHETDPTRIEAALFEHLQRYAAETYGGSASTAVSVQVAQARRRLQVVARRQAQRIADGWTIHATEASVGPAEGAGIEVDGEWMAVRGRFDRIDRHTDGRWAILDYKTHGHRPEKKHIRNSKDGDQWIDLQLPLYRMMIPYLGMEASPANVQLGYFNIGEKEDDIRINIAEFTEPQMQQAEELIRDCIRRIRAGDFQPTNDRVPFDDYGMILQTGVANRLLDQAELVLDEVDG